MARLERAWQLGPRELRLKLGRRVLQRMQQPVPRQLVRQELRREQQAGPREPEPLEPAQAPTRKKPLASSQAQRVHPGHRP